jgi:hypothetical protein
MHVCLRAHDYQNMIVTGHVCVGFWLDFWLGETRELATKNSMSELECAAPKQQERVLPRGWFACASYYGGTEVWSVSDPHHESSWRAMGGTRDNWGVGPNGTVTWRIKAPAGAASVTIMPPEHVSFEQDRDFVKIVGCNTMQGECSERDNCTQCTEIYQITGNVPKYSSYCDIKLNVDEVRIIMNFDSTNNFESRIDRLCWKWSPDREANETSGKDCPSTEYPKTHGSRASFSLDKALTSKEQRMTWVFRPPTDTKSITIDFAQVTSQVALPWGFRLILFWNCLPGGGLCSKMADGASFLKPQTRYGNISNDCFEEEEDGRTQFKAGKNLFDCYVQSCWRDKQGWGPGSPTERCYVPAPRVCKYVFPSQEVRITIVAQNTAQTPATPSFGGIVKSLEASFQHSTAEVPAILDGDCRLMADGADNLLREPSGEIAFDSVRWFAKEAKIPDGLGWPLKASRVRWVIKPSGPTQSITLSFKSIDLSSRYLVDFLYVLPDCNTITSSQYAEDILTDGFIKARVLNGNGIVRYGTGSIPCPLTIHSSCVILELDMTRRFVYTAESSQDFESQPVNLEDREDYIANFKGFSASYTSSELAEGIQTDWTPGGAATVCQPEYSKVPPPAPRLEWNELCCAKEEGNR